MGCCSLSFPSPLPSLCLLLCRGSFLSLPHNCRWSKLTSFRMMGGGPRTYPGGVTKWQWKRMQQQKARQIEKARLQRERHIYEMRRRAEIIAATSVPERPWERLSRFRSANQMMADEQVDAEDLWIENDGPQTFLRPDGEPSVRFFPSNAVYSTKMYRKVKSSPAGPSSVGVSIENQENDMTSELGRLGLSSGAVASDVAWRNDWQCLRSNDKFKRNLQRNHLRRNTAEDSSLKRHANWKGHRDA
eukprot:c20764_g2_i1 orf=351-1085(-)